jgi:hypothetical protein
LRLSDRSQGHRRPWLHRFLGPVAGLATASALLALVALPAMAHPGGSMGINLSAERLPPGGPLEVIGTDFSPGETLQMQLVGPTGAWVLPEVTTGPDGHFAVVLSVPADATAGFYTLDAVSLSGIIQRETFQVDPAAPAPALTPSPTGPGGAAAPVDLGPTAWLPLIAVIIVAVLFVAFVTRRRPRSTPLAGPAPPEKTADRR